MYCTSNSVLRRLIQSTHRMLNKAAQDAIQRVMPTSNIIMVSILWYLVYCVVSYQPTNGHIKTPKCESTKVNNYKMQKYF